MKSAINQLASCWKQSRLFPGNLLSRPLNAAKRATLKTVLDTEIQRLTSVFFVNEIKNVEVAG